MTESLWKWFSLKNTKLEEQLSLRSFFIVIIFDQLYLVNLCPIFIGSFQNLGDSEERNWHIGLISAQSQSLSWMGNLLIQSYLDSNIHTIPIKLILGIFLKGNLQHANVPLALVTLFFLYSYIVIEPLW